MAPDSPSVPALPAAPGPDRPRDKVRFRFRKGGDLRLLSHHDLMRTFERMLRRAALPFRRTQGFHPKPRLVFALSLPLGVVGCEEVVELELDEVLPPEEIRERLARQTPAGLEILSVRRIEPRAGAQVRRLCYAVDVPPERVDGLAGRIGEVLAAAECWVDRNRPPQRRVDLRPFLHDLRLSPPGAQARSASEGRSLAGASGLCPTPEGGARLEMDLWLTPGGTARPEELLRLLGLQDLAEAGAVIERARLELADETVPSITEGIA
jgi:radical SAM-linked protein